MSSAAKPLAGESSLGFHHRTHRCIPNSASPHYHRSETVLIKERHITLTPKLDKERSRGKMYCFQCILTGIVPAL